ncbi:MAG: DNA translocase FtsK [Ruminococcaceae bacterium]|nr:DNA translocase FtsK [Oscillospiraceae bacterium]
MPRKAQKKTQKKQNTLLVNYEIVAIVLIAVTVFFAISLYFEAGGIVGNAIKGALTGLFGTVAYLIPLAIIALLVYSIIKKGREGNSLKYISVLVLMLDLCAIFHMLFAIPTAESSFLSYYYRMGHEQACGGAIGALIALPVSSLFGNWGANILFFALLIVMVICIFEISVFRVIKAIFRAFVRLFAGISRDLDELKKIKEEEKKQIEAQQKEKQREKEIVVNIGLQEPPASEPEAEEEPYVEPPIMTYENGQTGLVEVLGNGEEEEKAEEGEMQIEDELSNAAEAEELVAYTYPDIDLLTRPKPVADGEDVEAELKQNAKKLVETLKSFKVDGKVVEISRGPTVTRYELKPAAGVKVNQITNLANDIALNLAAKGVMVAPISGKSTIGIELGNKNPSVVTLREVLETEEFLNHPSKLAVALGKDISGKPIIMDLAKMPHLLVAGATGAGKSVCINTLVISILYKADPNEVKLVMIDPKQVELGVYNGIPHLLIPVVKDAKKAAGALNWAVTEMTERYSKFERNNVRNIQGYNELMEMNGTPEEKLPQIVILIDEFADLMMVAPGDVENYVCRIAQLARAAGMHLVIATQRPVVKFITGNIKANVPSRISFMVASVRDSQTILDMGGAEKLVGKGDMLYMPVGETKPSRMQCAFVSDAEVKRVVEAVASNGSATYNEDVLEQIEREEVYDPDGDDPGDCDEFLPEAVEMAIVSGQISTSLLQRRFKIGYNRAGRIIDQMEQRGIISGLDGNKPRQVLISREEYNEMLMSNGFGGANGHEE